MKKIFLIIALTVSFVSCSDKVYEELNTDPTKAESLNPSYQLAYAEKQIFGDMNYVDVHRLYTFAFTQHLMGCWNTSNYGGQHRVDDIEMSRPWNNLYAGAFRNLTDAIAHTKDVPEKANVHAALTIFRVYVGSLLTDCYGDVPYSEAGLSYLEDVTRPKYDTQEEIYQSFFKDLEAAVLLFDAHADPIESDPMFNGDIDKWKKFANSLRLRYAMRISDVLPELAEEQFIAALKDPAGVMGSEADDACVMHEQISYSFGQESYKDFRGNALAKYFYGNDPANNPSYVCKTFWNQLYSTNDPRTTLLCRFYIEDFMDIFSGEGRIDMTEPIMATQAANPEEPVISAVVPGDFSWDEWPVYSKAVITGSPLAQRVDELKVLHPDYLPDDNPRWLRPKLAANMLRSENPGVIMTYAEVCFLRAEALVKGWKTGDGAAKSFYEDGIRAAIGFVTSHYGYEPVLETDIKAYIGSPAIAFAGDQAAQLEQINTQAWILHFHNPSEAWANQRRSDYPVLPEASTKNNPMIDGKTVTPVRLCYPLKEETYNNEAYQEAKSRVAGTYNWNAPVWWDDVK